MRGDDPDALIGLPLITLLEALGNKAENLLSCRRLSGVRVDSLPAKVSRKMSGSELVGNIKFVVASWRSQNAQMASKILVGQIVDAEIDPQASECALLWQPGQR